MKKLVVSLLLAVMVVSVAGCGEKGKNPESVAPSESTVPSESIVPSESTAPSENIVTDNQDPSQDSGIVGDIVEEAAGAVSVLQNVWGLYGDNDIFPVAGGDMENAVMDGPGIYSINDAEALDVALGFPQKFVGDIDDAASLMHMMNANTFTCGVFHVTDSTKLSDIAAAAKENLADRQWICGAPEKLVVASVDDYVLVYYGESEIMQTFTAKLKEAYGNVTIISEDTI